MGARALLWHDSAMLRRPVCGAMRRLSGGIDRRREMRRCVVIFIMMMKNLPRLPLIM